MAHLLTCVEKTVVHIDIEHQRSVVHLFAGDGDGFVVILFLNQSQELARTGNVAALTHIDESHFVGEHQGLETGKC